MTGQQSKGFELKSASSQRLPCVVGTHHVDTGSHARATRMQMTCPLAVDTFQFRLLMRRSTRCGTAEPYSGPHVGERGTPATLMPLSALLHANAKGSSIL